MGGALASPASFASGLVALVALAVSTKLPVPVLFGFWLGLCLGLWLGLGFGFWPGVGAGARFGFGAGFRFGVGGLA